ncbi:flagellar assembly protein FliX [Acetobacter sp.]|uniref:flagellar assembly protein FliX n=1 Tax=Acetobacter sp. TaxID=440 RepID=UPI0025C6FF09|nr:flagellar assembly protein FliX [Acetobacter sp.]MCH4090434.1 flagellar assembly protein FliX [Acetobacter sp.]MCI1299128.1 flagellar assembly protein FliX [Acetobacter sp.]MCI1315675.1 flagellar assembly protein FliX [Acetobacter sp.]
MNRIGAIGYVSRRKPLTQTRQSKELSAFSVPSEQEVVSEQPVASVSAPCLLSLQESEVPIQPRSERQMVVEWGGEALEALKKLQIAFLEGKTGTMTLLSELEEISERSPLVQLPAFRALTTSIKVRVAIETAKMKRLAAHVRKTQ